MTHAHTQLAATLVERVGALAAALEQTTRRDVDDDNDASACAVTTTTSTTTMTTAAQLMRTSVCFVREVWERLPRSDAHGTALATAACLPVWELMMQAQQQQRQQAGRPHRDAAALLLLPRVLTRLTLLYMYAKAHDRRCLYQQLSCSGAEPATTNATTAAAASGLPLYVPLPLRTECLRFAPSSSNSSSTALAAYVTALQFVRHTVQREMQLAAGGAAAAAQAVTRAVQSLVSDVLPACVLTVRARRTAATHANTTTTTTTRPAVRDVVRIVLDDNNKGNADEHEHEHDDDATSWRVFASMLWRYMVFAERYAADAAVLRRLVAFLTSSTWSQTTLELPCANAAAARALALSLRPSSSSSSVHSHRGSDDGGDNNNTDGRAAAVAASDVVCIRYADILTPLTDAFAVCLSVSPRVPSTAADNAPLIDAHVHARCLHGTATAHDVVATHDVLTTLATPHAAHVRSRNDNDNDEAATATTLPDMARHVADVHASLARVCDDVSWDGVSGVCRDADQLTLLLRGMLATPLARHHGSGCREVDDDKEACRNHASDNNDDESATTAVLRFDARAARELLFSRKRGRDTAALLPRTTTLAHFASHTPSGGSSSTADAASLTTLERLCTQWAARE